MKNKINTLALTLLLALLFQPKANAMLMIVKSNCIKYTIRDSYGNVWQGESCDYSIVDDGSFGGDTGFYDDPFLGDAGGITVEPNNQYDADNDGKSDCWKDIAEGDHNLDDSDDWGDRTHPITGATSHHNGIDIQGTRGTIIRSVANATVTQVVSNSSATSGNGAYIRMRYTINGQEYEAVYLHLNNDTANVSVNDNVSAGQAIAEMNSTGGSTGDHLHLTIYEVNADGIKTDIDPAAHLGGESCAAN